MSRIDNYEDDDLDFSEDRYADRPKRRNSKARRQKARQKRTLDFDDFDEYDDTEYDFDSYEDLDQYIPDDHGSLDSY